MINGMDALKSKLEKLGGVKSIHIRDVCNYSLFFIKTQFKPFVSTSYEYQITPPREVKVTLGQPFSFQISQYGDFINDMVMHISLGSMSAPPGDKVKYANFLGHKILPFIEFEVDGKKIDSYTNDMYNFFYQYKVPPHKRIQWNRCVGQESPRPGYLTQDPTNDNYRLLYGICDGPQTPKAVQEPIDMYIPLIFDFNQRLEKAIPYKALIYGQTLIKSQLASLDEIAIKTDGTLTGVTPPTVELIELITNNLFISPEIQEIYMKRIEMQLIRLYRIQYTELSAAKNSIKLNNFKYPIESIYFAMKPIANNTIDRWDSYMFLTPAFAPIPAVRLSPVPPPTYQLYINSIEYYTEAEPFVTATIQSLDIKFYNSLRFGFYNSYTPLRYGVASNQRGICFASFSLYPGDTQVSGYLNVDNVGEIYLSYTSDIINMTTRANLITIAETINFFIFEKKTINIKFV